jgi:putative transposase
LDEPELKQSVVLSETSKSILPYISAGLLANNPFESRKLWMLKIFADAASSSSKHQKYKFWEDEYHPVELYSNDVIDQKVDYVHENPVKEGVVDNPEDYVYSSARDYSGMKGLLEIVYLDYG